MQIGTKGFLSRVSKTKPNRKDFLRNGGKVETGLEYIIRTFELNRMGDRYENRKYGKLFVVVKFVSARMVGKGRAETLWEKIAF